MKHFLHHLFSPRESNNHRARILHGQPLFLLVCMLLLIHFLTPQIEQRYPEVLGITANISIDELVQLTNQRRAEAGLPPLTLNEQLSQAASMKASDMITKNYWAHNAPDGTTPWFFIKSAGYDYIYAGENLARGFTTAQDAMTAWMASPGHKENIMSANYKEVGFAVTTGVLTGDDTVLIVQEFGSRSTSSPSIAAVVIQPTTVPTLVPTGVLTPFPTTLPQPTIAQVVVTAVPTPLPTIFTQPTQSFFVAGLNNEPLINSVALTKTIALAIGGLFIGVFVIDIVVIERKKVIRIASHNIDHILFLLLILAVLLLYSKGAVL